MCNHFLIMWIAKIDWTLNDKKKKPSQSWYERVKQRKVLLARQIFRAVQKLEIQNWLKLQSRGLTQNFEVRGGSDETKFVWKGTFNVTLMSEASRVCNSSNSA